MAMGQVDLTRPVHQHRIIRHAREIQHHLVHFRFAIAAHGKDIARHRIEHLHNAFRIVAFRQVIAGAVVQDISQQHQGIGLFRFHLFQKTFAPIRGTVDIGSNHKFHSITFPDG